MSRNPFFSRPTHAIGSLLLAMTLSAPPVAAQSSNHRFEATDPNAPAQDEKAPAQAAPAPTPRSTRAPRVFRVVRPGVIHAEANIENTAPITGGGQTLSGAGMGVGSKDKSAGANASTGGGGGGGGGSTGFSAGSVKPRVLSAEKPAKESVSSVKPPKQGIRVVDDKKNPIASGSFFDTQTVYFQIFGYEEKDTSVCLESLAMLGNLIKDCADFVKLPDPTYAVSYNNGKFSYAGGIWEARYKSINLYDTIRISVKNSKGEKSVATFTTKGSETRPYPMNRYFVDGKLKNPPYKRGELVDVHVFGFGEKDTYVCTQIRDDAAYRRDASEIASCSSYDDFSTYVKLPSQNWSYRDGVWIKRFNTNEMRLDTTYYVRLKNSKNVELPSMLQVLSRPPGYVTGPQ